MILEILLVIAAGEIALVALMIVFLAVHAFVLGARARRRARLDPRARQILYEYVSDPLRPLAPGEHDFLSRLRWHEQVELLAGLARSLAIDERPALFELARVLGVIERAKRLAHSPLARRRIRGVRVLTLLSDDRSAAGDLIADVNPEVRADAVEWAADEPTAEMAARIAPLLEGASLRYRFAIVDALIRMRGAAVEPLRTLLETSQDPVTVTCALQVAKHVADARLLAAALSLTRSSNIDVARSAALVLGAIGGAQAPTRLRELLGHESGAVRAAAIRALRELDDVDSAEQIAARLRDTEWSVRREAALSLRAFGTDGMILLRQMTSSSDPFAADMARQVVSLPEGTTA